jgi:Amt family ammonium transporter
VGVDVSQHAETAYAFGEMFAGHFNPLGHRLPATTPPTADAAVETSAGAGGPAKEDSFA